MEALIPALLYNVDASAAQVSSRRGPICAKSGRRSLLRNFPCRLQELTFFPDTNFFSGEHTLAVRPDAEFVFHASCTRKVDRNTLLTFAGEILILQIAEMARRLERPMLFLFKQQLMTVSFDALVGLFLRPSPQTAPVPCGHYGIKNFESRPFDDILNYRTFSKSAVWHHTSSKGPDDISTLLGKTPVRLLPRSSTDTRRLLPLTRHS